MSEHRGTEVAGLFGSCELCGRDEELFELPGAGGRYCLSCSADLATALLLTEEIDAGTMSGREVEGLAAELSELSAGVLARSQSLNFGGIPVWKRPE
jgi:hypothetical protein